MIRSLTTVKRRGLQFAVTLMSAALLIGMSAGLTGSKAFAASTSGTTSMYNWDFSSGTLNSDFNANTLTAANGGSISGGKIALGPTDSSKTGDSDTAKYYKLANPINLGTKAEGTTWSLSAKFSMSSTSNKGQILCSGNDGSGDNVIRLLRPASDDALINTSTTLIVSFDKWDGYEWMGRAAYITNVTDAMLAAGITLNASMNSSGFVNVGVTRSDGTSTVVPARVNFVHEKYSTDSTFDFDRSFQIDKIGYPNKAGYVVTGTMDYFRFNTTVNDDNTFNNSITSAKFSTANVITNGATVKAVDNGDGTATYSGQLYGDVNNDGTITEALTKNADGTFAYNGVNYKYNTTTKKFEVVTVTPATVTVAKATISKATVGKKSVKTTWKAVSNATGYQVSVNTKKSGTKIVKTITSGKTVTYTKTKLKKGKVYYVSVRAFNTTNGTTTYGSWSTVKKTAKVK